MYLYQLMEVMERLDSMEAEHREEQKEISGTSPVKWRAYIWKNIYGKKYMKYLLKLESTFKMIITHRFSAKYGHDNDLKIENFDNSILYYFALCGRHFKSSQHFVPEAFVFFNSLLTDTVHLLPPLPIAQKR